MTNDSRWAKDAYPGGYRDEVDGAISFSGLKADFFLRGKADCIVSLLDSIGAGAASARCLDIGCGIGAMHPGLVGRLGSLVAVDVSAEALEAGKAANPGVEYRHIQGGRIPADDASFDMAFAVCVMHHVPSSEWAAFVAEAWRVTKPGGMFAVFEHNPVNPMTRLAVLRCPFDHDAVLLSPKSVGRLLAGQGFALRLRRFLFFLPLTQRWARKVDGALGWLPLGAQYVVCGRRPE